VTTAAGAHDQQLVLYNAASTFTRLTRRSARDRPPRPRERRHKSLVTNLIRAIVVAFTLLVNLARAKPRDTANTRATEHHD
jgi:hypothetical protein